MMLATWYTVEPSAIAFSRCCRGTRLGVSANRAGELIAWSTELKNVMT